MKRLVVLVIALTFAATPALAAGKGKRGATRVDFDDALIKGQTNRGAVHLIERKDSDLGSLVKKRKHFRRRILKPHGYKNVEHGLKRIEKKKTDKGEKSHEANKNRRP